MKVTVKMTAEEFETFRQYQQDKSELKRAFMAPLKSLREEHGNLCALILNAVEDKPDATIETQCVIKNESKLREAVDLAAEWFC